MTSIDIMGQGVEVADGYLEIAIKEPFYSAGKQFGWKLHGIKKSPGIGLSREILGYANSNKLMLRILVDGKRYIANPDDWVLFAIETNSYMNTKGGVILVIYPWERLRREMG